MKMSAKSLNGRHTHGRDNQSLHLSRSPADGLHSSASSMMPAQRARLIDANREEGQTGSIHLLWG
jgi:hypothetical protein